MNTQNCPQCGNEMRFIPAGISKKTKKPYKAFFSCPECRNTMNAPDDIGQHPPEQKPYLDRQERIEEMHKEKTDNINKGLSYKLAVEFLKHSCFQELKIAELRNQVVLIADWFLQQLTDIHKEKDDFVSLDNDISLANPKENSLGKDDSLSDDYPC